MPFCQSSFLCCTDSVIHVCTSNPTSVPWPQRKAGMGSREATAGRGSILGGEDAEGGGINDAVYFPGNAHTCCSQYTDSNQNGTNLSAQTGSLLRSWLEHSALLLLHWVNAFYLSKCNIISTLRLQSVWIPEIAPFSWVQTNTEYSPKQ